MEKHSNICANCSSVYDPRDRGASEVYCAKCLTVSDTPAEEEHICPECGGKVDPRGLCWDSQCKGSYGEVERVSEEEKPKKDGDWTCPMCNSPTDVMGRCTDESCKGYGQWKWHFNPDNPRPELKVPTPDMVNEPPHYKHPSGTECIEITEHFNFCLGNAIKYIWRSGLKGNALEDLKKAAWYLNREIERISKS